MGTKNQFFFGTQFLGILCLLASQFQLSIHCLHDDVTCTLFALILNAANRSTRQQLPEAWPYVTQKDDTIATCNACKAPISSKESSPSNRQKHLLTQQLLCSNVKYLTAYLLTLVKAPHLMKVRLIPPDPVSVSATLSCKPAVTI